MDLALGLPRRSLPSRELRRRQPPLPVKLSGRLSRTIHRLLGCSIGGGIGMGVYFVLLYVHMCTEPPTTTITTITTATTTTSASAVSTKVCPKCGSTRTSGKLSCCARGGAWFKNCGDGDDPKFDHTWVQGIQACQTFVNSNAVKLPSLAMFHQERTNAKPQNTLQQEQNDIYSTGSDVLTTDSQDCVELSAVAAWVGVLFTILHLQ